ncbi:MAG: hypothetical protein AAF968_02325 [Pseudomonadota bacterium]
MQATAPQTDFVGKSILWIDDRVSIHGALIEQLRRLGLRIAAVETVDSGLQELENEEFDQILLDAMLGHESALPKIPQLLNTAGSANLSVCSGFMYREFLQEQRLIAEETSGRSVGIVDKTALPDIDEPSTITSFLQGLFGTQVPAIGDRAAPEEANPLQLEYGRYVSLSLEGKMEWLDQAEPRIRDVAENYFSDGYVYLLFCGSLSEPALSIDAYGDIPDESDVLKFAKARGFAPLAVHNVGVVDDIPVACCDRSGLKSYPTLRVSANEGDEEEVHFDNGASRSLLSYEWYVEKGWAPHSRKPDLLRVGEMRLKGILHTIEDCSFIDGLDEVRRADFSSYYIMQWEDCRLAVPCGPNCGNSWKSDKRSSLICRYRTGLLGRTLPRDELKVEFTMNFGTGKIRFLDE